MRKPIELQPFIDLTSGLPIFQKKTFCGVYSYNCITMVAWMYVIILILQALAVDSKSPAILSVTNVRPGATATFECSLPYVTHPTTLDIKKDNARVYQCTSIAFTCSKISSDTDYSVVTFTGLGTESAKGTFTVAHADQTSDGGEWTCIYGTSLISSPDTFVVSVPSPATLSVTSVLQGATATFECSYPHLESPTSLDIYKDNVAVYLCSDIAFTCKTSSDTDYSDVTFTDLDTASAKGTFTVANADQTGDGGDWTCKYGSSLISSPVSFVVTDDSSSCPSSCIGASVAGGFATIVVVVVVVWWCCGTHRIGYITIKKVTHDSVQLRWSMEGLHPKTLGLKAICGEQHRKVGHEDDGTHTLATNMTICMKFTNKDGRHGKKILMEIQTMKDHFRDMAIENVTLDTIHLRWSMNGFHPGTLGLKAICKIQDPGVCLELDGTHTATVENLAPDTSITIYLEYTDKDNCKETLIQKQTMKETTKTLPV